MTLRYLLELYTKARIMSWLTHSNQHVYLTTTVPIGIVHTNLATFYNGRLTVPEESAPPPASLVPDTVPEEWIPKPPEPPESDA